MEEPKERQLQLELLAVAQKPGEGQEQFRMLQGIGSKGRGLKEKRESVCAPVERFHVGGAEALAFRAFKPRSEETNKMYTKEQILAGRKIRDEWKRENSAVMCFAWTL